jgi:hypothetical protein
MLGEARMIDDLVIGSVRYTSVLSGNSIYMGVSGCIIRKAFANILLPERRSCIRPIPLVGSLPRPSS